MDDWKPIESAPKDGSYVIVTGPRYSDEHLPPFSLAKWEEEFIEEWVYENSHTKKLFKVDHSHWNYECGIFPTHWMPLPKPPEPTEYEMTDEDCKALLDACKPVPYMVVGGFEPSSPQENANRAWKALGDKMGFDYATVKPVPGKPMKFFTAVPSETKEQKLEREKLENEAKHAEEITHIRAEIIRLNKRLEILRESE